MKSTLLRWSCISAFLAAAQANGQAPLLDLREEESAVLPIKASIAFGVHLKDGTYVAGGPNRSGIYWVFRNSARRSCKRINPVAVATAEGDSAAVLVDGRTRRVFRFDRIAGCRPISPRITSDSIVAGTHTGRMWALSVLHETGAGRLMLWNELTGTVQVYQFGSQLPLRLSSSHLTGAMGKTVVSQAEWPFRWHLITPSAVTLTGIPFRRDTVFGSSADTVSATRLRSLGVLILDEGLVQFLAATTSDIRILVLYSAAGQPLRVTSVTASIGSLSSNPQARELLVLRRTNRLEIVKYGWRWLNPK